MDAVAVYPVGPPVAAQYCWSASFDADQLIGVRHTGQSFTSSSISDSHHPHRNFGAGSDSKTAAAGVSLFALIGILDFSSLLASLCYLASTSAVASPLSDTVCATALASGWTASQTGRSDLMIGRLWKL